MPAVPTEVMLDSELEKIVNHWIREGKFTDLSQAVNHGLILLREQEILQGVDMEELRREVQLGIDELDRGEGIEMTDEFFRQIHERGLKRLAEEREKGR
jgi:antitoxin ParD1/3/4